MESKEHIELVKVAFRYISSQLSELDRPLISTDSDGNLGSYRVQGNFVPDVYFTNTSCMYIGEAKTIKDFERKHSQDQFLSYIRELKSFSDKGVLVVSIPWQLVATAKNYFRRLKIKECSSNPIVILNELGQEFVV